MKIPKARKLKSGTWFIQLRLGGESIPVSGRTEKDVIREAQHLKAEYLAGKRIPAGELKEEQKPVLTLDQAIDKYIADKSNTLSPSTIRGYRKIQNNRFSSVMAERVDKLMGINWQKIVNEEAKLCSPKYLKNAYMLLSTVVNYVTEKPLPHVSMPSVPPSNTPFLMPEEILKFVDAVKDTKIAVPALLALSSMRMSEIAALEWSEIPENPDFIKTNGAVVMNEAHVWTKKEQTKNDTSTRSIPILIPELKEAIQRDRKPSGRVLNVKQDTLRKTIHRICMEQNITDVTVHGLRHSFASLAYHLQIPEKITMEIGGWKNHDIMHKIYTHVAQSDISRYKTKMAEFYAKKQNLKNANENANQV